MPLGTFLIIFLCLLIGITIYLLSNNKSRFIKNTTFTNHYDQFVHLLINNRKFDILKVKSASMTIRILLHKDTHLFILNDDNGRLKVIWKFQSPTLGKREKNWSFAAGYSQGKMYDEILSEIRNYIKLLRSDKQFIKQGFLTTVY